MTDTQLHTAQPKFEGGEGTLTQTLQCWEVHPCWGGKRADSLTPSYVPFPVDSASNIDAAGCGASPLE